jgi:sugar phosphate isomerase/epimerase
MKLSIVLSTQMTVFQAATLSGDLRANFANLHAMGYQGVELAVREPALVDPEAIACLADEFEMSIPAIGTGQAWGEEGLSFTDPDPGIRRLAIERIKSHVSLAAHFDAIIIIGLVRGILKPGVNQAQAMGWLVEALQECCQAASQQGVRLALEPINRYETTLINSVGEGLELIKSVDADNFGLLLDTFHMNIEEPSLMMSMRACGSRIFHFHVADSNRWYPGGGHLDFAAIIQTLADLGYTGFISGEFLPKPDALTAAQKSIAHLRPILEKVSQGGS